MLTKLTIAATAVAIVVMAVAHDWPAMLMAMSAFLGWTKVLTLEG